METQDVNLENNESEESVYDDLPDKLSPIIQENISRFQGAAWFEKIKTLNIAIIGSGGIGSYTSFLISRVQPEHIYLFDFDNVDHSNLSGQLFCSNDVGSSKVVAMSNFIKSYSKYHNISTFGRFYRHTYIENCDIIIGALDNMEVRKNVFENWKANGKEDSLLIDGRLNAEEFQIFSMLKNNKEAQENYAKEWLFSSEEADVTTCSYKQTSFMANMIGTMITNIVVNYAYNSHFGMPIRTIPYKMYYSGPSMDFKID